MDTATHKSIKVKLDDSGFGWLCVSQLSADIFCVEEVPVFFAEEFSYKDIVRLQKINADTYEFINVIQKSEYREYFFNIPSLKSEPVEIGSILKKVRMESGHWERIMGGLLFIYLPQESAYDPTGDFDRMPKHQDSISMLDLLTIKNSARTNRQSAVTEGAI